MGSNAEYLARDLGGLLNIVPFSSGAERLPAALSLVAALWLLTIAVSRGVRSGRSVTPEDVVFGTFALCSILGIMCAFVMSNDPAALASGRFLLNCLYLIPIAIGVLAARAWRLASWIERWTYVSLALLFVLSGISSTAPLWTRRGLSLKDTGAVALVAFFNQHALSYGYGPYWGSNANAVTIASDSTVVVRPVMFDKANGTMSAGHRAQSSRRWYVAEDIPRGQKEFFVFVASDGEECADISVCIAGLLKQFGNPVKTLAYGCATVLVWDHPLIRE